MRQGLIMDMKNTMEIMARMIKGCKEAWTSLKERMESQFTKKMPFDPLKMPLDPMTRARAKKFKDALTGLVRAHLEDLKTIEDVWSKNIPSILCLLQSILRIFQSIPSYAPYLKSMNLKPFIVCSIAGLIEGLKPANEGRLLSEDCRHTSIEVWTREQGISDESTRKPSSDAPKAYHGRNDAPRTYYGLEDKHGEHGKDDQGLQGSVDKLKGEDGIAIHQEDAI
ncbi:hypothetical protein CCACVL1_28797 [Corchorus capsularis]|uniref:Uncharacterized protein n=1 Tax=Corchorus capsularis TaxID=210143 RepID=A0A1R3G561_COCAP|nr:hypothetical protein CCACVL1_28797 [Corchorus capsularis]